MRATVIIDDAQDGKNNSCRTAATSSRPVKKDKQGALRSAFATIRRQMSCRRVAR